MPDTFHVAHAPHLSMEDVSVLSQCYLPLISADGLSLYLFLVRLADQPSGRSMDYPISYIYDMIGINPERFLDVRKRLEGAQLLKTLEADVWTFRPVLPLSPAAFFKSPLLAHLKTRISKERVNDIKDRFVKPAPKWPKKEEVTASFEDTFGTLKGSFDAAEDPVFRLTPTWDMDAFLDRIPTTWVPKDQRTPALKTTLNHLAYVYGLDETRLKKVIEKAVAAKNGLDFDGLSDHAAALYLPESQPQSLDLDAFKRMHPADVLKLLTGSHVPASELKIVDRLIRESGLKLEVISVLIAYVITELNGQMPVYKYFEKVSGQWHRNEITTAEMAIAHIKSSKEKKTQKSKKPKEAPTIDWFKAYLEEKEN